MSTVTTFRQIRRNNESMINRQYLEFSAENVKPHSRSSLRSFLGNDQSIILRRCKQLIRRKVEDDNGICQV
jgi:predicted permease